MCPGGPNHCRVGWAGSHSHFCQLSVILCFQLIDVLPGLVVIFLLHEFLASRSSSCYNIEYNVFITLVHTHIHKKKLHLLHEACCRTNGRVVTQNIFMV
jgi:hypothetical protein